jgi:hypothetical protein
LTCWLGELLTEGWDEYQPERGRPITRQDFEKVYAAAIFDLPNNNILNIIGKARKKPYKQLVLDLETVITRDTINIKKLLGLYQQYLKKNRQWLFKDAPRRDDSKIREAVFHFNLFSYLNEFLKDFDGNIFPEFPTGNGKVDLLIRYEGKLYALEVKTFSNLRLYREALEQAARYAKSLGILEISLVFFIDMLDEKSREKYETPYQDDTTGVTVKPLFIETAG